VTLAFCWTFLSWQSTAHCHISGTLDRSSNQCGCLVGRCGRESVWRQFVDCCLCLMCEWCHFMKADIGFQSWFIPYGPQGDNTPWFVCWFQHYIIFCSWVYFLPPFILSFFFPYAFFLTYLLPCLFTSWHLSTPSRIDPFCFQAWGRRMQSNPLVFSVTFIL